MKTKEKIEDYIRLLQSIDGLEKNLHVKDYVENQIAILEWVLDRKDLLEYHQKKLKEARQKHKNWWRFWE